MLGTQRHRTPPPARRRAPAPVITAVDEPALIEETTLVIAVTGRRHIIWDPTDTPDLPAGTTAILVTDADTDTDARPVLADLAAQGVSVRTVTVTADPTRTGPPPLFHLPVESPEFAAHLGADDHPDLAVHGAVGGAGASTFAAALAGALADPACGGGGQSLLVDADGGGLAHLLALENDPGRRLPDLAGTATLTAAMLRDLPWAGDVAVLTGHGEAPAMLDVSCPVVRDRGRFRAEHPDNTASRGSLPVLVVPATVPGALAGREALAHLPGAAVVLREIPRAELEWNDALTLLDRAPEVTWKDDPFLTGDTDRGDFTPGTGTGTGTAGTAAARLVTALQGRLP